MKPAAMGPSTTNRQTVEKEKAETKRLVHFHRFLIKQILNTSAHEPGLEHTNSISHEIKTLQVYAEKPFFFRVLLYQLKGLLTILEIKNII
jgi:hypothetical protein